MNNIARYQGKKKYNQKRLNDDAKNIDYFFRQIHQRKNRQKHQDKQDDYFIIDSFVEDKHISRPFIQKHVKDKTLYMKLIQRINLTIDIDKYKDRQRSND